MKKNQYNKINILKNQNIILVIFNNILYLIH